MSKLANLWLVLRADDAGNAFLVEDELAEAAAHAIVEGFSARGHKQTYTAYSYCGLNERAWLLARMQVHL